MTNVLDWEDISRLFPIERAADCWLWKGPCNRHGYGVVQVGSERYHAHRHLFLRLRGAIEPGIVLDHICRNRACVNPDHLDPVTSAENTLRGQGPTAINALKTHCSRGHEFTPENTTQRPNGARRCKVCNNSQNGRRTCCKRGHAYTDTNIVLRVDGSRQCKTCLDSKHRQSA